MPLTPAELARLKIVRQRAVEDAERYMRSRLFALEEHAIQELYQLYLTAYGQMSFRLFEIARQYGAGETWSAADLAYRDRTDALMAQIASEANVLMVASQDATFRAAAQGYQAGYYGSAWQLDQGLRGVSAVALQILPTDAIRAALLAPYEGSTFVDRFANARDEFVTKVRQSIVQSQINGDSIYQAQRRLADALGIDIGRKTQAAKAANSAYFARTEMIARTEILKASNQGALAIYAANQDVLQNVFEWISTRDERTCPICGPLDGQRFALDSGRRPPIHTRCRCTVAPVLLDQALERRIVGPRQTYTEWAAERGISVVNDGGVMRMQRGAPPPKSPSGAARAAVGA